MITLLMSLSAQAQDCTPAADHLVTLGGLVERVQLEEAHALAQSTDDMLRCQTQVVPSLSLATLFQLTGSVFLFQGDPNNAALHYGRAVSVAPSMSLDPMYGDEANALYDQVRSEALTLPSAELLADDGLGTWVDGRRLEGHMELSAGFHLVQHGQTGELTTLLARVSPEQKMVVTTKGLVPLSTLQPDLADEPVLSQTRRSNGWLLAGGGATLLGAASLVGAGLSHQQFDDNTDLGQIDSLQTQTNALAIAGGALITTGLTLGGVALLGAR